MIVVEDIFRDIFSQLPDYVDSNSKSFKVNFAWGGEKDLSLYLKSKSGNVYPLVWLVEGKQTDNRYENTSSKKTRLIIAKNSHSQTSQNPSVWDSEFRNCLNPLLDNVVRAMERSGVIVFTGNQDVERRANYTDMTSEDKAKAIDFWNVIVLDIDLVFQEKADGTPKCINNNIFKLK